MVTLKSSSDNEWPFGVISGFRIPVETEDVVKTVLVLCGCRFCSAFIFNAFSLITNEVDF